MLLMISQSWIIKISLWQFYDENTKLASNKVIVLCSVYIMYESVSYLKTIKLPKLRVDYAV